MKLITEHKEAVPIPEWLAKEDKNNLLEITGWLEDQGINTQGAVVRDTVAQRKAARRSDEAAEHFFHQQLAGQRTRGAALALGSDRGRAARLPDGSEKTRDHLHQVSHCPRKWLVIPSAHGMPQGMGANVWHRQVGQSRQ
jgi:hypothetical protein